MLWVASKHGSPLAWCRKNGHTWVPNQGRKPSPEEIESWRQEQIRVETARKEAAEQALRLLNNEKVWERLYAENTDWSRGLYHERGFTDWWIKYLQFGFMADYEMKYHEGDEWLVHHTPALSIPVWAVNRVNQIKLRILNPKDSGGKYRNYYEGVGTKLYVPLHDLPLSDCSVLICEGELKAALMAQTLDKMGQVTKIRPVGIPSKRPSYEIFDEIKDLSPVYLWLDFDAFDKDSKSGESAVEYCVRILGKERVRIVTCPVKSDDAILAGHNPMSYLRMAKRA